MEWNRWWRVSFRSTAGMSYYSQQSSELPGLLKLCGVPFDYFCHGMKSNISPAKKLMVGRWDALSKRSLWKGSTFLHFRRVLGISRGALINNAGVSRPQLKGLDLLWPKYSTRRQSYVSMLVVNISPFYIRVTRVVLINHKSAFGVAVIGGCWWSRC